MNLFERLGRWLSQIFSRLQPKKFCADAEPAPNPHWVSMVNVPWFGAYGHGEGTHLLGYPAEIDWDQIEADFQKCNENFVQVVRAFIFENLDGLIKIGSVWDVHPETLLSLARLKQLLRKYQLKLAAVLFEFKNAEAQPFLPDFLSVTPMRMVIDTFIRQMREVLWAIDLHNEIDYLHLVRKAPLAKLSKAISGYRAVIKGIAPSLPYTCSTGWKGGYWARRGEIGVEALDFIEVHHYTHHHGDPWERRHSMSLCGLEKLDKPVLLGEFKSDDFSKYVPRCRKRGFLGAAPWSVHHDFPISETTWQLIRTSQVAAIT
jgi:hypothetical protein